MVRAAAKNHATRRGGHRPGELPGRGRRAADGGFTLAQRRRLAAQAYAHTAAYDAAVASWFASGYAPDEMARETGWPDVTARAGPAATCSATARTRISGPRCTGPAPGRRGIAGAEQLHGKAMSYNNYVDADAARRAAFGFAEPCVAIMKHANPCGIAIGADLAEAHRKAHACDPVSAFGGVIAANGVVTAELAAADRGDLHRGGHRARLRAGRAGDPDRGEEPAAAALPAAGRRRGGHRLAAGQRRHADADARTGSPSPAMTRRTGGCGRPGGRRGHAARTWGSPGAPAGR